MSKLIARLTDTDLLALSDKIYKDKNPDDVKFFIVAALYHELKRKKIDDNEIEIMLQTFMDGAEIEVVE